MVAQNLLKGDPVYPTYSRIFSVPIPGNATPTSFVKGELASINTTGRLAKITSTKVGGVFQVMNAVTGGLANDNTVTARVLAIGSRILLSLPAGAKRGSSVQINGTNGTGNVVISTGASPTHALSIGTVIELYKNAAEIATAGDLGVVEVGLY